MSPSDRFSALTALLAQWQPFWRPLPFRHREPPWAAGFPELARELRALDDRESDRLQDNPFDPTTALARWLPVFELAGLVDLPALPGGSVRFPEAWAGDIGGRKWRQIEAFAPRIPVSPEQRLVEWCAGKAHLGRTMARWHGVRVLALEADSGLCTEGQALADRQRLPVALQRQDVLDPDAERWLEGGPHIAALHACGDLHERLLLLAARSGCSVTLAPCCYQRTAAERHRPLSALGRELATASELELCRDDLALAVQESVTAPRSVRRARQRAAAWRLGFDVLQRELTGVDSYLPVPSLAYGRFPGKFADFCRWAAGQKGIDLPAGLDWEALERTGWQRQREVSRLEHVRHLFRRPLETWLVLDRARFLEESGFRVELGTFCPREVTPRNLLLRSFPIS